MSTKSRLIRSVEITGISVSNDINIATASLFLFSERKRQVMNALNNETNLDLALGALSFRDTNITSLENIFECRPSYFC